MPPQKIDLTIEKNDLKLNVKCREKGIFLTLNKKRDCFKKHHF